MRFGKSVERIAFGEEERKRMKRRKALLYLIFTPSTNPIEKVRQK